MKLYLVYIPLFLITYQNTDREKEVPGKYIGHFLGKHELILKNNGKFVSKGYGLVPKLKHKGPIDPPPGNMPSPVHDRKKRKYKTKGNWVYFKKDSLDGVVLKTRNQTDSLFFLENGNLSPNNPNANYRITSVLNDRDTLAVINHRIVMKEPNEFIKQ